jgi:hypothetical protein
MSADSLSSLGAHVPVPIFHVSRTRMFSFSRYSYFTFRERECSRSHVIKWYLKFLFMLMGTWLLKTGAVLDGMARLACRKFSPLRRVHEWTRCMYVWTWYTCSLRVVWTMTVVWKLSSHVKPYFGFLWKILRILSIFSIKDFVYIKL